jgi:hypothetical protein
MGLRGTAQLPHYAYFIYANHQKSLKGQVLKYQFQFESNLYCSLSVRGSRVSISPHASKKEGRSLSLSVINV